MRILKTLRTYYDRDGVTVTREFLSVYGRCYRIQELKYLQATSSPAVGGFRRQVYELVAEYQGHDKVLFRTSNARVFGQVSRAVLRSYEAYENGHDALAVTA